MPAGVGQLRQRPPAVDRHQVIAQVVVRCVEGDRQVHGQLLLRQSADSGHEADRGDGEVPCRESEGAMDAFHSPPGALVVGERLTHTHEHDVRDATLAGLALGPDDLFDDLTGGQVSVEAHLPGGAEAAPHGAA